MTAKDTREEQAILDFALHHNQPRFVIFGTGGAPNQYTDRADFVRSASKWGTFPILDRETGLMQ